MSVLVIMGVMVSVAIKKFDIISDSASITAIKAGVRELNTQETLVWTEMKLSDTGSPRRNCADEGDNNEY